MGKFDMGGKVSVPASKSNIAKSVPKNGEAIGKPGSPVKTMSSPPSVGKGSAFGSSANGIIAGKV